MVYIREISVSCKADGGMQDITREVRKILEESKVREGIALIFCVGSTGAVTTIEFEPGLRKDFPRVMERIAPSDIEYEHHRTWGDDNGRSHVRASIVGPSLVIPVVDGKPRLGTWQQVVIVNFDTRPRERRVVVVVGGS